MNWWWQRASTTTTADGPTTVTDLGLSFSAAWAQRWPALVWIGCALLIVLAVLFYMRYQPTRRTRVRWVLALGRGGVMALLLLLLAEPTLVARISRQPRPWLWLLFDGSESMAIADELPSAQRRKLAAALDLGPGAMSATPSWQD